MIMAKLENILAEINGSLATIASLYLAKSAYDGGLISPKRYADMIAEICKNIDNNEA